MLVGQDVEYDIEWLDLTAWIDYKGSIDLATKFRKYNTFRCSGQPLHYSADLVEDAVATMEIYEKFFATSKQDTERDKLWGSFYKKALPPRRHGLVDGVCGHMYQKNLCFCGQPRPGDRN